MEEIELEKTYLAKFLPEGLLDCEVKELVDIYVPKNVNHPTLRIRKKGNKFEITKKTPITTRDASRQTEVTIGLDEAEYTALCDTSGKVVKKTRYFFPYKNQRAEIDVFGGELTGLVLVDFEFTSVEQMQAFEMPDFCLVDVTQENFIARGMLCGKKYSDIEEDLIRFGYKKLEG